MSGERINPGNGREIDTEDPMEMGAQIEASLRLPRGFRRGADAGAASRSGCA